MTGFARLRGESGHFVVLGGTLVYRAPLLRHFGGPLAGAQADFAAYLVELERRAKITRNPAVFN